MSWLPWARAGASTARDGDATSSSDGDRGSGDDAGFRWPSFLSEESLNEHGAATQRGDERGDMDENPLNRDAPVEVKAEDEPIELLNAAMSGDATAVYMLLEGGVDVDTRETRMRYFVCEGFTPLHYASREGHTKVVEELLAADANVEAVDERCGATALQEASLAGHADIVRLLLNAGADPDAGHVGRPGVQRGGHNTKPPLYLAAYAGWDAIVRMLLVAEARPNLCDWYEQRPLHVAAKNNHVKVIDRLLATSADVNVVDCLGQTPLHIAIRNSSIQAALRLLKSPTINVDARDPKNQATALHMAAEHELPIVIEALLRLHPKLQAQDKDGATPLHIACWSEVPESVRLLLEAGASVNAETAEGALPMDYAFPTRITVYCKVPETLETIRLLLSHGAKWDTDCDNEVNEKFREAARPAVRLCVGLWEAQRAQGRPLTKIPAQVVESGESATLTYIKELEASKDVTLRRKVCVVGPSQWGKTSLVKSIVDNAPVVEHHADRTIGVERHSLERIRPNRIGSMEHNHITFWDFAGQDEYHAAHSLFYSRNTLYVVCIDVEVFRMAHMQSQLMADTRKQRARYMTEFVDERILRWVLTIIHHHPDAEFEFALTKFDTLERGYQLYMPGTRSRRRDFESEVLLDTSLKILRIQAIVDNMKKVHKVRERQKDIGSVPLVYEVKPQVVTSVGDPRLIDLEYTPPSKEPAITSYKKPALSRAGLLKLIFKSDISFPMPDKYSRVLSELQNMKDQLAKGTGRVNEGALNVDQLTQDLCARVEGLEHATCRVILRALRDLGDILWFEDLDVTKLRETVFLDTQVMIDLIRQIINHNHDSETISHMTLKGLPLWSSLDRDSMHAMKQLLQHFQLVHPTAGDMAWDSDLLVPAFRRTKTCANAMFLGLELYLGPLDNPLPEAFHVHWEYHFESGLPITLFDHLAVESYSPVRERLAGPDWILYGNPASDTFACRIMVSRDLSSKHRTLQLEAVLAENASQDDAEALWDMFEHLSGALVRVLGRFRGLILSKFAMDREGKAHGFTGLFETKFPKPRPVWMPPAQTCDVYRDFELTQELASSAAEVFDLA